MSICLKRPAVLGQRIIFEDLAMRPITERSFRIASSFLVTVLYITALMLIFSGPARTAEFPADQVQTKNTRNPGNPLVKLGRFPPDFELPKLTFSTDAAGKPVGLISEKDTIRLSDFRGKKPVCLIMSSYT